MIIKSILLIPVFIILGILSWIAYPLTDPIALRLSIWEMEG